MNDATSSRDIIIQAVIWGVEEVGNENIPGNEMRSVESKKMAAAGRQYGRALIE